METFTIIKLKDKYLLLSNEEIKEGDWCLDETFKPVNLWFYPEKLKGKIIAGIPELPQVDFSLLSEEDCKRIGWIDVEKLGFDRAVERLWNPKSMETRRVGNEIIEAVKFGFKTAQSLNDEVFSLEDIVNAYSLGIEDSENVRLFGRDKVISDFKNTIEQSLQQTGWEVKVEMCCNKYTQCNSNCRFDGTEQPKITNNSIRIVKIFKTMYGD